MTTEGLMFGAAYYSEEVAVKRKASCCETDALLLGCVSFLIGKSLADRIHLSYLQRGAPAERT